MVFFLSYTYCFTANSPQTTLPIVFWSSWYSTKLLIPFLFSYQWYFDQTGMLPIVLWFFNFINGLLFILACYQKISDLTDFQCKSGNHTFWNQYRKKTLVTLSVTNRLLVALTWFWSYWFDTIAEKSTWCATNICSSVFFDLKWLPIVLN